MNEIIEVHERDMDVVVQPGMPYELLNEELKEKGLFFPVDVSTSVFQLKFCLCLQTEIVCLDRSTLAWAGGRNWWNGRNRLLRDKWSVLFLLEDVSPHTWLTPTE